MKFGLKFVLAVSLLPVSLWAAPTATNYYSVVGRVLYASDSTPVVGVNVSVSSPILDKTNITTIDANIEATNLSGSRTTDANGYYRIDSLSGTGYLFTVTAVGYVGSSTFGPSAPSPNSIDTLSPIYLARNVGVVSGIVSRADSTIRVLKNAKMIFYVNNLRTDSVFSDSSGHYNITLNAATYTMKSSLEGYRSNTGLLTRDTTVTVSYGQTTTSLVYLTPATGTISGSVTHSTIVNPPIPAGPIASAKVYIARRMGAALGYNAWTLIDSTLTDANGCYSFGGLIPATGNPATPPATGVSYSAPGGNYRVLEKAVGWTPNFDTTQILTSVTPTTVLALGFAPNSTTTANLSYSDAELGATITSSGGCPTSGIYRIDNQHFDGSFAASNHDRTLEIYDLNGVLHKTISVPAGEIEGSNPHFLCQRVFVSGEVTKLLR